MGLMVNQSQQAIGPKAQSSRLSWAAAIAYQCLDV